MVKWRVFNPCRQCGGQKPAGNECQPCWGNRRKNNKSCDQDTVIEMMDNGKFKDVTLSNRRDYARDEQKDKKGESQVVVSDSLKAYNDEYDEGHFY